MNVVVVVQARMSSTRLPGKVMLPLAGQPMLIRQLERIRAAATPFDLVVATTTDASDDAIVALARGARVDCFRGHPTDLLDRHVKTARAYAADVVVKIPSDCPLIDPAIVDRVLTAYLAEQERYDFVSNLHPATYPDGNDVEVMSMAALDTAWREAKRPHEREHTTPFLWDQPERFRVGNVAWETGLDYSMSHRFTVDYREDYELVRAIYGALHSDHEPFTLERVLAFLTERPELYQLNAKHAGVNWYRHHLADLATVDARHTVRT